MYRTPAFEPNFALERNLQNNKHLAQTFNTLKYASTNLKSQYMTFNRLTSEADCNGWAGPSDKFVGYNYASYDMHNLCVFVHSFYGATYNKIRDDLELLRELKVLEYKITIRGGSFLEEDIMFNGTWPAFKQIISNPYKKLWFDSRLKMKVARNKRCNDDTNCFTNNDLVHEGIWLTDLFVKQKAIPSHLTNM